MLILLNFITYSVELKKSSVVAKENYLRKNIFNKISIREKINFLSSNNIYFAQDFTRVFVIFLIFIVSFFIIKIIKNSDLLFIYLSFLAISAIRIIPSMNIISNCISTFKFYSPSYNVIKKEVSFHNEIKEKFIKKN